MYEIDLSNFRNTLKTSLIIDDIQYRWVGWYKAILESHERGLKVNETRFICGIPFHVYRIEGSSLLFWKPKTVSWIPVFRFDEGWIQKFHDALFRC